MPVFLSELKLFPVSLSRLADHTLVPPCNLTQGGQHVQTTRRPTAGKGNFPNRPKIARSQPQWPPPASSKLDTLGYAFLTQARKR